MSLWSIQNNDDEKLPNRMSSVDPEMSWNSSEKQS